jgi:predicted transcriptional regulator
MLQAKTIMTKDVVTVRPQDTLDTVIEILVDSNIT